MLAEISILKIKKSYPNMTDTVIDGIEGKYLHTQRLFAFDILTRL